MQRADAVSAVLGHVAAGRLAVAHEVPPCSRVEQAWQATARGGARWVVVPAEEPAAERPLPDDDGPMAGVTIAHTAQLDAATLAAAEALLRAAFVEFDDEDWEHALGGMHALVHDGGRLVAHGSVVQRRFLHGGRAWRTGYVEAVGVAAGVRRRGHGTTVMGALETVVRGGYELGALSATADGWPLYRSLGWQPWQGPVSALTPAGTVRTPDEDGAVFVLPVTARLDPAGELTCDWRDGPLW